MFQRKKYLAIALIAAIFFFALSHYLTVLNIYQKSILIFAEMNGALFTIFSVGFNALNSILFGWYLALLLFQRGLLKSWGAAKGSSAIGAAGQLISAGCPSCGAPILSWLGAPLLLYALPLKGLEIKILSFVFLLWAVYWLNGKIYRQMNCQIKNEK